MTLTYEELLEQFRVRSGLSPSRAGCSIDVATGFDADALLKGHIAAWYADLIENSPEDMLDTEDVAGMLKVECAPDGAGVIELPDECRRVFSIRLRGWEKEAEVLKWEEFPRLRRVLRASSSIRRTVCPVALLKGRRLYLYSVPEGDDSPTVAYARGATLTASPETYRVSAPALSRIPPLTSIH